MASKGSLLRNIRLSGGLFTENILLRLRDNPTQLKIGKIETFNVSSKKELDTKQLEIFEWCKQKWDEISSNIDSWKLEELIEKWLIPFFKQFEHEIEDFEMNKDNVDEDSPIKGFQITHQSRDYQNPFFHFVNINEEFDSKISSNPQGKSYHNICQQYLNLNPKIEWLIISNGRILRFITKYYHTYSKGFLEFDIENILANRDLIEFNVLYHTLHSSRFIAESKDQEFLINKFQKYSVSEGVKIGDALRDKVHDALELLGGELIQQNPNFLEKVFANEIDPQEYYAELLRIIYRIIFILYAEQREMLPCAGSIYFEQLSLSSLRFLSEKPIKAEENTDLWNKLFLTFKLINEGNDFLGVNAYNGSLFKNKSKKRNEGLTIIFENKLKIINETVLKVIRLITTSKVNKILQRINFLEISEEEIGAVYESLLDYKPIFDSNSHFQLIEGTERKSTGSYYTPKALIDILIRTTLQPLVENRLKSAGDDKDQREKALLDLKVCDPACGGGTFLLSALDYLGKKLAEVRTGSDSPLEEDLREARREILQHCIYGVDMNPLAVELAKISLWLRACVKNKPLNFLDNHIKCGNSLIGLGQKLDISGINPKAFKALSGNKSTGIPSEESKLQNMARKKIRDEIKQQKISERRKTTITEFMIDKRTADICSTKFQEIVDMSEKDPEEIKEKERKYEDLKTNENYRQALNEANIWTSTFFWPFEGNALGEIPMFTTIEQLRNKSGDPELRNLMENINEVAIDHQFFHWYIEFPEVFSSERGGFDCILTNPPWEVIRFFEMEFFIGIDDTILNARNQSERRSLIIKLKKTNPGLFNSFKNAWQLINKQIHFYKDSDLFLLSSKGPLNTYALFTERNWSIISPDGFLGIITPSGLLSNYYVQDLFREIVEKRAIVCLFDFINNKAIFDIHRDYRFCLLSLSGKNLTQEIIPATFYTLKPREVQEILPIIIQNQLQSENDIKTLPDDHNLILLEPDDFKLFNPNTMSCPSFRIRKDAIILKQLYQQTQIFIKRDKNNDIISNPWEIKFYMMFQMAGHSKLFLTKEDLNKNHAKPLNNSINGGVWINNEEKRLFPLYEGRMIWHYNHRLNSMDFASSGKKRKAVSIKTIENEYKNPDFYVKPNYWVQENDLMEKIPKNYKNKWFLGFREVTGSTNERTFISTIIPYTAVGHKIILMLSPYSKNLCLLMANTSSIVFDYIVRLKLSGISISINLVEQLPIFPPAKYNKKLIKEIFSLCLKLIYTSNDLKNFSDDLEFDGKPFEWDLNTRAVIKAEIDAIYAHLYRINKEDMIYILNTFKVLKRKELKEYKEFKTERLIIEAYDKYAKQKELFE